MNQLESVSRRNTRASMESAASMRSGPTTASTMRAAAMRAGVVVIGTPAHDDYSGGAQVWVSREDTSDGGGGGGGASRTWVGPTRIVSVDRRPGWMGAAAATDGGDVVVLGAPKDSGGGVAVNSHDPCTRAA